MNTPQAVTTRYATNLLHRGKNPDFEILLIDRRMSLIDEVCVGVYYEVTLRNKQPITVLSCGTTPIQAVIRGLEKLEVTFK